MSEELEIETTDLRAFDASTNTIKASKFKTFMFCLFGKTVMFKDDIGLITVKKYKGKEYLVDFNGWK